MAPGSKHPFSTRQPEQGQHRFSPGHSQNHLVAINRHRHAHSGSPDPSLTCQSFIRNQLCSKLQPKTPPWYPFPYSTPAAGKIVLLALSPFISLLWCFMLLMATGHFTFDLIWNTLFKVRYCREKVSIPGKKNRKNKGI